MNEFSYFLPTKIVFGTGAVIDLANIIKKEFPNKKNILLVTGRNSLKKNLYTDRILRFLEDFTIVVFDKVSPNPTSDIVNEGIELFKKDKCDLIISVGGGSVIDTGKAIALLLNNNDFSLEDFQTGKIEPKNLPVEMIAIPTTSGTSSELTMWSVITNQNGLYRNLKKSIGHKFIYPKLAILDPELTLSLPPYQTASTGLDALSHAIEGCLSKKKNILSDIYLLESIKLLIKYLPVVFTDGLNLEAREKVSFAVLLVGLGFSNSRTMSPHKISYPITTHYNLPHGAACMLTLPYFFDYIGERQPDMTQGVVEALGCNDYKEAVEYLINFVKRFNLPTKLSELGITEEGINFIAKESYVPVDKQEDPIAIKYEDYLKILKKAF